MKTETDNPSMVMDIERVKADALHGVSLARMPLAERDPAAARATGIGVEPGQKKDKKIDERRERQKVPC